MYTPSIFQERGMTNRSILIFVVLLAMQSGNVSAQDWANMGRYQAENDLLTPVEGRVVFMGDSITEGWLPNMPDFFSDNPYVNRGISGQVTSQMLLRFRADVLDLEPAAVVILAGTNDIAENQGPISLEAIAGNIKSMAELAFAHGVDVIICSVLPASDYPWRPGLSPNTKIPELNEMLQQYADQVGFMYLDFFAAMNDGNSGLKPALTTDGVHVTAEGYAVMAELVQSALNMILAE